MAEETQTTTQTTTGDGSAPTSPPTAAAGSTPQGATGTATQQTTRTPAAARNANLGDAYDALLQAGSVDGARTMLQPPASPPVAPSTPADPAAQPPAPVATATPASGETAAVDPFADLQPDSQSAMSRIPAAWRDAVKSTWSTMTSIQRATAVKDAKDFLAAKERTFQQSQQAARAAQQQAQAPQTTDQPVPQPGTPADGVRTPAGQPQGQQVKDVLIAQIAKIKSAGFDELAEPLETALRAINNATATELSRQNQALSQLQQARASEQQAELEIRRAEVFRQDAEAWNELTPELGAMAEDQSFVSSVRRRAEAAFITEHSQGNTDYTLTEAVLEVARGAAHKQLIEKARTELVSKREDSLRRSAGRGAATTTAAKTLTPKERDGYVFDQLNAGKSRQEVAASL